MDFSEPPMEIGETLQGTDPNDSNVLINGHWLGQLFTFPASRINSNLRGNKSRFTGRQITAMLCRNTSGAALLPKRFGLFRRSGGYDDLGNVDGYCAVTGAKWLIGIDCFLPAAGVPANGIFWGFVAGPFTALTPFAEAGVTATIAIGDELIGSTAASTATSAAGRVCVAALASVTDATGAANVARMIARALSARTTGETNADILVELVRRY